MAAKIKFIGAEIKKKGVIKLLPENTWFVKAADLGMRLTRMVSGAQ